MQHYLLTILIVLPVAGAILLAGYRFARGERTDDYRWIALTFSIVTFAFYVFFEASLVPMFFLIGIWGGERRVYAAVKFFIYTAVGSLLMLVGIIALYFMFGSFDYATIIEAMKQAPNLMSARAEFWLFLAFALAFC